MGERIEGRSRELLEDRNFGHVVTLRDDGTPHVTVVWVDVEDDELLLNSADGRLWPDNLRRDPRITVTVVNLENPYEYVVIAGRVDAITPDGADEHIDKLAMKYLGQREYPYRAPGEVRLLIRVRPDKVSHRAQ